MKERPILMSAPMVIALLAGRKTQTRRVVKPQPEPCAGGFLLPLWPECPYGYISDRLWVREAWAVDKVLDGLPGRLLNPSVAVWHCAEYDDHRPAPFGRYRHARFMPRWASRITLEVTEIRVERLQDIGWRDCAAEGVGDGESMGDYPTWQDAYMDLWDRINGPGAWDKNPWIWAISFKVLHG